MRKFGITLLVIGIAIIGLTFRFNVLGMYHEYLKDEIVDLGGHGVEKVKDIQVLEDGSLFVSSITEKGYVSNDGFVRKMKNVLLSKVNSSHRVEYSYMIDNLTTSGEREIDITNVSLSLDNENNVYLLVGYLDYEQEYSNNRYLLYKFDSDCNLIASQEITDVVDSLVNDIVVDNNNQLILVKFDGSAIYRFDDSLVLVDSTPVQLNMIQQVLEFNYRDDKLLVFGKNHTANVYAYSLVTYEFDTNEVVNIMDTPLGVNTVLFEITDEYFLYAAIDEDPWHIDELEVTIINLADYEDVMVVNCDVPSSSNKIPGIGFHNDTIYLHGWEDAPTHVDGVYYMYDLEGTLVDKFDSNIGGIDSIIDMYFYEDQVISVITTKRIVDWDYIRRYNNAYDNIIKFK